MIKIQCEKAEGFKLHEGDNNVYLRASAEDYDKSIHLEFPQGDFWLWFEKPPGDDAMMTIDELIEGLQALKARWED